MNRRDVEQFYNDYKTSLVEVARLEKRLLKESYSYEKWFETMQQLSKLLRDIYTKNLDAYQNVITYAIEHADELSDKVNSELLVHIDFFLSEGFRDYGITVPVLKAIIPYWEKKGNPGKIMDCYYFLGIAQYAFKNYKDACDAFTRALECFDSPCDCTEPYWAYRYLCGVYYRLLSFVESDELDDSVVYKYYTEAREAWSDSGIPDIVDSAKKKDGIVGILRNVVCHYVSTCLKQNVLPSDEIINIVIEQSEATSDDPTACGAKALRMKYLYLKGELSEDTYVEELIKLKDLIAPVYRNGYTYGRTEFTALFDNELPDDAFSPDDLFINNPGYMYARYVLSQLMFLTKDTELIEEVSYSLYRYFLELPVLPSEGAYDKAIRPMAEALLVNCPNEDMVIDCTMNLFVHRQISTTIHVTMVARLTRCIAQSLINSHPEYFVGILDTTDVQAVAEKADEILEYAYRAALCHDIGKIMCTDVIKLQNRKILDEEFARIRQHPQAGYILLTMGDALREYAPAALCHHLFDDGSRGYPFGMKIPDEPVRIVTEIITVCDSIEAMSDAFGRNYANPKDMTTIITELNTESGTRYSARVLTEICEAEGLIGQIEKELYVKRSQVNFEIYRRYVVPDTKFVPKDECYVVPVKQFGARRVCDALDYDRDQFFDVYDRCKDYSYGIVDGNGSVHGIFMCERDDNNWLWIREAYVIKESRRQGLGTMMVNYLERVLESTDIEQIYAPEKVEGHYDKFAWHNGFISSDEPGWLVKIIK